VKVGVTLPQFVESADAALDAASRAESLGLDGVFCFDHLWPLGQPERPAISSAPLLGAVVASTERIAVGTLVARIGLVPDQVLAEVLVGLSSLSGGRVIAGLGTGDRLSKPENEAYGLPFEPAAARRARVGAVAAAVTRRGVPVWIGGGLPDMVALARTLGAAVNLWESEISTVADISSTGVEVTWAGPAGDDRAAIDRRLRELAEAGATWAVCAWPDSLEVVAESAAALRGSR
jgi:alkanesulfonate monooxygenase SsuD/methylene tetrahydromethanopterin reductase-like flavin-dependent oxidoreductase (luciferase family)